MPHRDPSLCRISLHAEDVHADLALPARVPIAALIPEVVDVLAASGYRPDAAPYRLSRPGAPALDSSMTLAQHAIRDGAVLLMTSARDGPPEPRFDDPADRVAATARAQTRPWTPRTARLTAALVAIGSTAVAGFVAVPGGPGAPNALLAAAAAATASVLMMHLDGVGTALVAVCCLATLAAAAASAGVLTRMPLQTIGAVLAATAVGLLQSAPRLAAALAGLSPRTPAARCDARAAGANDLLVGLVAACSAAAALGVLCVAAGARRGGGLDVAGVGFVTMIGAALLLRARAHTDRSPITALTLGGFVILDAGVIAAPQHAPWPTLAAVALAGLALYRGFAGALSSPITRRGIEVFEYLALAAVLPLMCWVCGWYGAVRGMGPAWP